MGVKVVETIMAPRKATLAAAALKPTTLPYRQYPQVRHDPSRSGQLLCCCSRCCWRCAVVDSLAQVTYAYLKHLWAAGFQSEAFQKMGSLSSTIEDMTAEQKEREKEREKASLAGGSGLGLALALEGKAPSQGQGLLGGAASFASGCALLFLLPGRRTS